jgi:tyrosine-protein phosphatase SIW14
VYRSSFPRKKNSRFLRSIGLRTVVSLVPEEYPDSLAEFYSAFGIEIKQFGLQGNRISSQTEIDVNILILALFDVLNPDNHPVLIHCNKGMHRTGCLVGCLRKLRRWAVPSIIDEYRRYSTPRDRQEDVAFIEMFDEHDFWIKHSAYLSVSYAAAAIAATTTTTATTATSTTTTTTSTVTAINDVHAL